MTRLTVVCEGCTARSYHQRLLFPVGTLRRIIDAHARALWACVLGTLGSFMNV